MTSPQSIAAAFAAAADLIEPEGRWTKYALARGKRGRPVEPEGKAAICWCGVGALRRVTRGWHGDGAKHWLWLASLGLGRFNDAPGRTQQEVVAKLREAARTVIAALPPRSM